MKTYEEMARDVLRRRDEELSSITQASQLQSQINPPPEVVYPAAPKKRGKLGLLPKIAIPCAATVLVGVVGLNVWKNVRGSQKPNETMNIAAEGNPNNTPAADENSDVHFQIYYEKPESIYKGGKTEINFNEVEEWNLYHLPALLEADRVPIADDEINNYYGMEFDRLTRLYPEWKEDHDEFCRYEHDEDEGVVASHRIIHTTNIIHYGDGTFYVALNASITPFYELATVENAKPSVINGFDAMVYSYADGLPEYAADIEMGIAKVQIQTGGVSREEFLEILDAYTKPDKEVENNQTQTTEDKIVVLDGRPDFIMPQYPFEPDYTNTEGAEWTRYSEEQLNALYNLNFTCLSELHPDWLKMYDELNFGVFYIRNFDAVGGDIPQNREIIDARNKISYQTSEGYSVSVIAGLEEIPEEDIEHSTVNGFDAVIFSSKGNYDDIEAYGAAIDMNGTLVCITVEGGASEEWFVDFLREYTSEASNYTKPDYLKPIEITTFNAADPFDRSITYKVSWDVESCWWSRTATAKPYGLYDTDTPQLTIGYLGEFFRTDFLPVDEQYKSNFKRYQLDGRIECSTAEGAKAYSPVDGKVVGVCYGYNNGLGNSVAVEFNDYGYLIIGHLDEINVEVGDIVEMGNTLGVCGHSGNVYYADPPLMTLMVMQRTSE